MVGRERPAWGWRLLAWTILVLVGLTSLPSLPYMSPKGWMLAAFNYVAIAGTFSYAYARRPRPLWFWRAFGLLFSFNTVATLGAMAGRLVTLGRDASSGGWIIFSETLLVCVSVCIALLRHSQWLRGRQQSANRTLEGVFA